MIKIPARILAFFVPIIIAGSVTAIFLHHSVTDVSRIDNYKGGPFTFSMPKVPARLSQKKAVSLGEKYLEKFKAEQTSNRGISKNSVLIFNISNAKVSNVQYRLVTSSLHPPGVTIKNTPCYVISFGNIFERDYVKTHYQTYNQFNVLLNADTGDLIAGFAYSHKND